MSEILKLDSWGWRVRFWILSQLQHSIFPFFAFHPALSRWPVHILMKASLCHIWTNLLVHDWGAGPLVYSRNKLAPSSLTVTHCPGRGCFLFLKNTFQSTSDVTGSLFLKSGGSNLTALGRGAMMCTEFYLLGKPQFFFTLYFLYAMNLLDSFSCTMVLQILPKQQRPGHKNIK